MADGPVELEHGGLDGGADVEDAACVPLERREYRVDDVRDVHVIARLPAVTEDPGRAALVQQSHEDRDNARLAVRLLTRAVHIAQAERDVARAVQTIPRRKVFLPAELRRPVGRERPSLCRLADGPVALAVDRPA